MTTGMSNSCSVSFSWRAARLLLVPIMFSLAPRMAAAQDPPFQAELVGSWDGFNGSYADVWGDGDYAYMGQFGSSGVFIIDISNPSDPVLAAEYAVPAPNNSSSAQDVKVGDGLLFIGLESNSGPASVQIVDVRDPPNPVSLTTIDISAVSDPHDVFYDRGYLYIVDSSSNKIAVVDLTDLDPDNPPGSPITQTQWVVNNVGSFFVHDITVRPRPSGETWLYACAWSSGLFVYNVTNIADQPPQFLASVGGLNTHSCWPTDDGKFVITGEEREGGGMSVFEIVEDEGGVSLVLRDSLNLPTDQAYSIHNQVCVGNRVYNAWYQAGMRAYDVDPVSGALTLASSLDTFSGPVFGFDGAWGVYPLLGSDRVLVSDLSNGLFIIDDQATLPLVSITYPDGLVDMIHPVEGATLLVNIAAQAATPDPDTATLFVETSDLPGDFEAIPMTFLGDDLFVAQFPPVACGNLVSYYVSIGTLEGDTVTDPADAPDEVFTADVVSSVEEAFSDDFEIDTGWTTFGNPRTGAWERAVPQGSGGGRGDPLTDFDGSGQCFVTGNGFDEDVDEGPVALVSPTIDLSAATDWVLRYARWFTNDDGDDFLTVEISNDDGGSWVEVETVGGEFGWVDTRFDVADFVTPTDTVVLRFITCDCPNDSVTEAAIDAVRFQLWLCEEQPACQGDANGDGTVDPLDAGFVLARFGCPVGTGDPDCDAADQNGDGSVDPLDSGFVLARFGECDR
ncbi:MAG: hypothetical protein IH988_09285 [Planctomycetes bacterium]|nr:hypothetical protein [Planctomycetota bacterium]